MKDDNVDMEEDGKPAVPCVDSVSMISKLTVGWLTPLISLSRRRPIHPADLPPCPTKLSSDVLRARFATEWAKELTQQQPSLLRALLRVGWSNARNGALLFALFGAAQITMPFLIKVGSSRPLGPRDTPKRGAGGTGGRSAPCLNSRVSQPCPPRATPDPRSHTLTMSAKLGYFFVRRSSADLQALLQYLTQDKGTDAEGAAFAIALGVVAWAGAQAFLGSYLYMQRMGMEARVTTMNAVFERCLAVPAAEIGALSLGTSTNLMSVDAEKLYLTAQYAHALWLFPAMCITVLCILTTVIGLGAVAGIALLCAMLPLQLHLTKRIREGRQKAMKAGDSRVKYMSEILQHIRTVKLHAWEEPVEGRISSKRREELGYVPEGAFSDHTRALTFDGAL